MIPDANPLPADTADEVLLRKFESLADGRWYIDPPLSVPESKRVAVLAREGLRHQNEGAAPRWLDRGETPPVNQPGLWSQLVIAGPDVEFSVCRHFDEVELRRLADTPVTWKRQRLWFGPIPPPPSG